MKAKPIEDRYEIIEKLVDKFDYPKLTRKQKHLVLVTLKIFTGYKHSQLHQMGYFYINQKSAPLINDFYIKYFNPYLNFHRPCGFATLKTDKKGKQKKVYNLYQTPYVAFKGITGADKFLKPGISLERLCTISKEHSDNEFARIIEKEKQKLFKDIKVNPIDF